MVTARCINKKQSKQNLTSFPLSNSLPPNKCRHGTALSSTFPGPEHDAFILNRPNTTHTEGIPWPRALQQPFLRSHVVPTNNTTVKVSIISIDKSNRRQVSLANKLLYMVNLELGAPLDESDRVFAVSSGVQIFLMITNNRAIGICTTDPILDHKKQCRWMVCNTHIVPQHVNYRIKVGVLRIWIAPAFRGYRLARLLLRTVQLNAIYGQKLLPQNIAFSQPTTLGRKLSIAFNGIRHKLGDTLIPVYIET